MITIIFKTIAKTLAAPVAYCLLRPTLLYFFPRMRRGVKVALRKLARPQGRQMELFILHDPPCLAALTEISLLRYGITYMEDRNMVLAEKLADRAGMNYPTTPLGKFFVAAEIRELIKNELNGEVTQPLTGTARAKLRKKLGVLSMDSYSLLFVQTMALVKSQGQVTLFNIYDRIRNRYGS